MKQTTVDLDSLPASAVLTTAQAATVINRHAGTLRNWAYLDSGPIRPVKIGGRLAWRASDLRALLAGNAP